MLIAAAAKRWRVAAAECSAEAGVVRHARGNRRLRFGELALEASRLPPPASPRLKSPSEFRLLGKPMKRIDGPDIVTGRARYGIDVRIPNMVFASIERAPVLGARIVKIDDAAARRSPGVIDVLPVRSGIQQGVGVVAASTWAALRARPLLQIQWDLGAHRDFDSQRFESALPRALDEAPFPVREQGNAKGVLAGAARRHRATYVLPFQAHAPLEPMNCTADVRADRAEFWAPTQTQIRCVAQATKVTGLPKEKIRIHATLMGGGFGRRLFADYLAEAAEISKALARPVQVVWTREDDMRHGYFEPCTAQRFEGGVDASGRLVAMTHRSTMSDLSIYDIHEGRDLYGATPPAAKAPDAYSSDQISRAPTTIRKRSQPRCGCGVHPPGRSSGAYPSEAVWGRESCSDEMARLAVIAAETCFLEGGCVRSDPASTRSASRTCTIAAGACRSACACRGRGAARRGSPPPSTTAEAAHSEAAWRCPGRSSRPASARWTVAGAHPRTRGRGRAACLGPLHRARRGPGVRRSRRQSGYERCCADRCGIGASVPSMSRLRRPPGADRGAGRACGV
jgi:hypothetical protein